MCLIVLAWRPGHAQPLLVASNRDEFYARPTQALAQWDDAPGVFAGRDLQAGGTWLGVGRGGRFAALTNIRDLSLPQGTRSRGELPSAFLTGEVSIEAFLATLYNQRHEYSGFNLLLGDGRQLCHFNSRSGLTTVLEEGVHGISNADLNTTWPKLQRAQQALHACLPDAPPEALLRLLSDSRQAADEHLPDTGIGLPSERLLSSVFIASPAYGTRASTALSMDANGSWQMTERSFGPQGELLGEVTLQG